jgi:membrane protease YdiL (CAAX protease family)
MRYGTMRAIARGWVAAYLLAAWPVGADTGSRVEQEVATVEAAAESAYAQSLARFDQAMIKAPRDASLAVERCQFIQSHTDPESGRYIERADTDAEACERGLDAWAAAPETQVYRFEQEWGDDARKRGDALLARAESWPPALRRRLAAGLAMRYRYVGGENARGKDLTILAAELGDGEHVGPAVEALAKTGETKRALALLQRAPPAETDWVASGRVRAALDLPLNDAARREMQRQQAAGHTIAPAVAALAHLRAGDAPAAKSALGAAEDAYQEEEFLDAKFRVGMALRDYASASAAVRLQDFEHMAENTGRFLSLAGASPASLLRPAMWTSLAVLLAMLAVYLLLPAILLVPVHYRGVVRRLAGRAPQPLFEPVGLRHAWMAAVVFLLVPMCVLAVIDPGGFGAVFADGAKPDPSRLLQLVTVSSLLSLLMFAPMVKRFVALGQFRPMAAIASWKRVLVAVGATLAVGAALSAIHRTMGADTTTQQIEMARDLINSGQTPWKGAFALLVIAVLVPVWEEFAFRGMALGGIARHVGFAWANLLQALVFALCHNDWPRFPYYLVMGLMAGWLVRSSGKLAPAILMHMTINALAFFLQRG